jgi:hypothetical protein
MTIPLSEAIRLGSLLVDDPVAGDIERCAIGMALKANGSDDLETGDIPLAPQPEEELRELDEGDPPVRDGECLTFHGLNVALCSHRALLSEYPWLGFAHGDCPWCGEFLRSTELLHHGFDEHVMAVGLRWRRYVPGSASSSRHRRFRRSPAILAWGSGSRMKRRNGRCCARQPQLASPRRAMWRRRRAW